MVLKVSLSTGINRNILEFKAASASGAGRIRDSINRNILEFKAEKLNKLEAAQEEGINRNILEFKES